MGSYFKTDSYAADHVKANSGASAKVKITSTIFTGSTSEIFYNGLDTAIKQLINSGKSVTLFVDVPELPFFPKDCFRNPFKECDIKKMEVMERQAELRNIVDKLKISNPSLIIFDPISLFCDAYKCSYKRDGVIFYRDSHHLTLRGSNIFAERYINTR